jgi:hypothetical protein
VHFASLTDLPVCAIIIPEVERVRKLAHNKVASSHEQAPPKNFKKNKKKILTTRKICCIIRTEKRKRGTKK